ncbi:MAG: efflux RND transporter periplasmic adaptor subunit [Candidatus Harrisonbacteria bacterium]|nr:efflux RND transporter periplasmic adaptor subunit [Candidatus Harrisonbacteria bacterium]
MATRQLGRSISLNKYYLLAATIAVIAYVGYTSLSSRQTGYETKVAERATAQQMTSLNGKVVANEAADLSFETGGRISRIYKKVGETVRAGELIMSLQNETAYAELLSAEASLDVEKARLSSLLSGARPEEISALQSKVNRLMLSKEDAERREVLAEEKAATDAQQALVAVITAGAEAVSKGKNALMTLADTQEANITLSLSDNLRLQDAKTMAIKALFDRNYGANFRSDFISNLSGGIFSEILTLNEERDTEATIISTVNKAEMALMKVKLALEAIPLNINLSSADKANLAAEKSKVGAEISTLSSRIEDISKIKTTGAQQIESAKSEVTSAINALEVAKNDLIIKQSGASKEDIAAEQAAVRGAEARVRLERAKYEKTLIRAPFAGTVAKISPRVQESVISGAEVVSLIGVGNFSIEAYIPEADIAKVTIGDKAEVSLDAYQKEALFTAIIATIDTSDTEIEGVTTYKVKLMFENEDERIRPGMTANLDIIGETRENVIVIPERAIKRGEKEKTVRVLKKEGEEKRKIETGVRGFNGMTEIISGLTAGEIVIIGAK